MTAETARRWEEEIERRRALDLEASRWAKAQARGDKAFAKLPGVERALRNVISNWRRDLVRAYRIASHVWREETRDGRPALAWVRMHPVYEDSWGRHKPHIGILKEDDAEYALGTILRHDVYERARAAYASNDPRRRITLTIHRGYDTKFESGMEAFSLPLLPGEPPAIEEEKADPAFSFVLMRDWKRPAE